ERDGDAAGRALDRGCAPQPQRLSDAGKDSTAGLRTLRGVSVVRRTQGPGTGRSPSLATRPFLQISSTGTVCLALGAGSAGDPFDYAQGRLFAPPGKWLRSG